MPQLLTVTREKIFDLYVRMRRSGTLMDEVVEGLQSMAQQLPREDRHQLSKEVLQWEEEYKAEQARIIKPIPQPVQTEVKPFGTQFLDPSKLSALQPIQPTSTPTLQSIELPICCPKCGRKNPVSAKLCASCKLPLKSASVETRSIDKQDSKTPGGTAQFAATGRIYLSLRNPSEILEVHLNKQMIIGRSVAGAPLNPTIDLARFRAEDLGVSRLHATLERDNGVIKITDMQSSNYTYVNGQRIYPQESRVLRHGDEIRLGKLVMKVLFKR